jgi:hypothetical protein
MYYENTDSDDEIILYETDGTETDSQISIPYSEEIQIYEEDIDFIQDENNQTAFDDISEIDENREQYNNPIGQFIIGTYKYIKRTKQFLFISSVPNIAFLKYNSYLISRYLYWHSSFYIAEHPPIDILKIYQVVEPDSLYPVIYCVIKTFWIKIIQRVWKRVFRERRHILEGRKTLVSIKYRELNGYFPEKYRIMPRFSLFPSK